ncbi:MAG: hypothetical protein R8G01_09180 [Ilumatobacteraceae bacterium]|nr:hypothetical protein [Ilumatobacteraceae bacterium]
MPDLVSIDASTFDLVHDLIGDLFGFSASEVVGLLAPPWSDPETSPGWILHEDDRAVGFLGAVTVDRHIDGEPFRFCNLTTWYVEPEHRGSSLAMMRPPLRLDGHVVTDFSPSVEAERISLRLGFQELETSTRLFEPETKQSSTLTVTPGHLGVLGALGPTERQIVSDHQWIPTCRWYVARDGDAACLIVASKSTIHRRPYLRIDHVSNPELFVEHADGIVATMQTTEGVSTVFAGNRFTWSRGATCARLLPDRTVALVANPGNLNPEQIDNLYSEVMLLDITTVPKSLPPTRAYQARQAVQIALWRMRQVKRAAGRLVTRRTE